MVKPKLFVVVAGTLCLPFAVWLAVTMGNLVKGVIAGASALSLPVNNGISIPFSNMQLNLKDKFSGMIFK
jgi:hypothetical protein